MVWDGMGWNGMEWMNEWNEVGNGEEREKRKEEAETDNNHPSGYI